MDFVYIGFTKTFKNHQLLDFLLLNHVISLAQTDVLTRLEGASCNLTDSDTSHIRGVFKRRYQKLRSAFRHFRCRNHLQNRIQKRGDI